MLLTVLVAVVCAAQDSKNIEFRTESGKTVSFKLRSDWRPLPTVRPARGPMNAKAGSPRIAGYLGRWTRGGVYLNVFVENVAGACNARKAAEAAQVLTGRMTIGAKVASAVISEPQAGTADLRMYLIATSAPSSQVRLERFVCSGTEVIHLNGTYVTHAPADFAKAALEAALRESFQSLSITSLSGK